jgi:hypothetical protein
MNTAAQLARIAASRPHHAVKIEHLRKNVDAYFWLCEEHRKEKLAEGWEVIDSADPPHELKCEECR